MSKVLITLFFFLFTCSQLNASTTFEYNARAIFKDPTLATTFGFTDVQPTPFNELASQELRITFQIDLDAIPFRDGPISTNPDVIAALYPLKSLTLFAGQTKTDFLNPTIELDYSLTGLRSFITVRGRHSTGTNGANITSEFLTLSANGSPALFSTTNLSIISADLFNSHSSQSRGFFIYTNNSDGQENAFGFDQGFLREISAVPEPSTWLMMIFGFILISFALRYRRKMLTENF